jgi:predicted RNA binding protein YcfA (HicA-like mRNA interferase family)
MSPKTPRINGSKLIRALEKLGFAVKRQKGSHVHLFRESDGRRTTVPVHGSKDIPIGTLKAILKDAEISADKLIELL